MNTTRLPIMCAEVALCLALLSGCAQEAQQEEGAFEEIVQPVVLQGYPVKVFFSKFPESDSDPSAVFAVNRVSPTLGIATFASQLLIAGPTLQERDGGYFSELNSILTGPSSCSAPWPTGGPDFKISLNKKGSVPQTGTATLQFCRATSSPGIMADARIVAQIDATLKQFSNITKVVILTQAGHCFGDQSGMDRCLN